METTRCTFQRTSPPGIILSSELMQSCDHFNSRIKNPSNPYPAGNYHPPTETSLQPTAHTNEDNQQIIPQTESSRPAVRFVKNHPVIPHRQRKNNDRLDNQRKHIEGLNNRARSSLVDQNDSTNNNNNHEQWPDNTKRKSGQETGSSTELGAWSFQGRLCRNGI